MPSARSGDLGDTVGIAEGAAPHRHSFVCPWHGSPHSPDPHTCPVEHRAAASSGCAVGGPFPYTTVVPASAAGHPANSLDTCSAAAGGSAGGAMAGGVAQRVGCKV
eukprot:gene252-63907_t